MEIGQSRRHGSGPEAVPGGAGMARPQGERGAGETMTPPVLLLAAALAALSAPVLAQSTSELMGKLQACSQLEGGARRDCLDKLSRELPAPPKSPPAAKRPQAPVTVPAPGKASVADTWFVTETTSPPDSSPTPAPSAPRPAARARAPRRGAGAGGGGGGTARPCRYRSNAAAAAPIWWSRALRSSAGRKTPPSLTWSTPDRRCRSRWARPHRARVWHSGSTP